MTKRRTKGEGTIYQRKDKRWVGMYTVQTVDGTKKRSVYGKDKKDVRAKLTEAIANRDKGLVFDAQGLTVGEYLDRWLVAIEGTIGERTWKRHEMVVRLHVKPAIGSTRLAVLSLTCSPKTDPATMRVRTSQMGRRRTLEVEEEAHSGADRPQAAPGGCRTGCRDFGPRGRQETRHKRGDLPPLAQPLRRHEGRCHEAPQGAGGRERPPQEDRRRAGCGHRHPEGGEPKKLLSPSRRRAAVEHVRRHLGVSERRACRVIAQPCSSQRYAGQKAERDRRLAERMVELSRENPRYGYRRVWALLRREGWPVNKKRVHRLWRQEGLKVPEKQHKRQRLPILGESENGCTRRRAEHKDHVWSYDFVMDLTEEGRRLKMMPV